MIQHHSLSLLSPLPPPSNIFLWMQVCEFSLWITPVLQEWGSTHIYEIELKGSRHNNTNIKGLLPTLLEQRRRTVLILCPSTLWKGECNCFLFNQYDISFSPTLWSSSLLCAVLHSSVHSDIFPRGKKKRLWEFRRNEELLSFYLCYDEFNSFWNKSILTLFSLAAWSIPKCLEMLHVLD